MKSNRNTLLYILIGILIIAGGIFWYQYQDTKQTMDEIQIQNEEWAMRQKYPWRERKLESSSDLQMCKTLIYNSNLTDEEKAQEEIELDRRYRSQQSN